MRRQSQFLAGSTAGGTECISAHVLMVSSSQPTGLVMIPPRSSGSCSHFRKLRADNEERRERMQK